MITPLINSDINNHLTSAASNGLNPVFNEKCEFDVHNPDMAFIRFVIQDEDMFGDPNFVAQATYPLCAVREGKVSRNTSYLLSVIFC